MYLRNNVDVYNHYKVEQAKQKFIGKTFGELTVLEIGPIQSGVRYYLCQCSCGNKELVKSNHLTHGGKKKCKDCNKRKRMSSHIGEKYNSLEIIDVAYHNNGELMHSCVKCKCDCGNEKVFKYADVKKGNVKTCGHSKAYKQKHTKCNEDCENCQYEDCILDYRDL